MTIADWYSGAASGSMLQLFRVVEAVSPHASGMLGHCQSTISSDTGVGGAQGCPGRKAGREKR